MGSARRDSLHRRKTIEILYRDSHLIAIGKPSGLAVHRGWSQDRQFALTLVRDAIDQWVYPIHRLDRATSGVLLFALDPEGVSKVQKQFQSGTVEKRYLALVRGITPEEGLIDHPVPRTRNGPRVDALTEFRRLGTFERYSWVEARPRTGRLHQIRRHFKHLSHPLIGDVRYGKGEHNRLFRERFGLFRLALHASQLRLTHPFTGEPMSLRAPLPADLAEPLAAMGLLSDEERPQSVESRGAS